MSDLEGIFPARVSAHLLERLPDELSGAENGTVFVAWPKPPRVGRRVRLELAFGDEPPTSLDALVVWARPPRPGVVGGFRAQLEKPPAEVLARLRGIVEIVRQRLMLRGVDEPPALPRTPVTPEPFAVTERMRVRASAHPRPGPRPLHIPTPLTFARPPLEPEPEPEELLESAGLELDSAGDWRGAPPAFEPPAGQPALELDLDLPPLPDTPAEAPLRPAAPAAPARVPQSVDALFADLAEELRQPPPATAKAAPVRVPYATGASYLVHYERFLQHGEVYVTTAAAPPVGATCALVLQVPDGEVPIEVGAIVVREVQPPEVPVRGWVAALVDPDGLVAERLTTASFVLAS